MNLWERRIGPSEFNSSYLHAEKFIENLENMNVLFTKNITKPHKYSNIIRRQEVEVSIHQQFLYIFY